MAPWRRHPLVVCLRSVQMNHETALPLPGEKRKTTSTGRYQPMKLPRLVLSPAPGWHRAVEWGLRLLAASAVIAIALILVFIAKEAAPLFYRAAIRAEVTLGKMW